MELPAMAERGGVRFEGTPAVVVHEMPVRQGGAKRAGLDAGWVALGGLGVGGEPQFAVERRANTDLVGAGEIRMVEDEPAHVARRLELHRGGAARPGVLRLG